VKGRWGFRLGLERERKASMIRAELFDHIFLAAAGVDIGVTRATNQDEAVCCPEYGFFAVSDGMGGFVGGGATSRMIAAELPGQIRASYGALRREPTAERAAEILSGQVRLLSDRIYGSMNSRGRFVYGATFCGVWLVGRRAAFVNLGDSRGYILRASEKGVRQVTNDHNVAAALVEVGVLGREEAVRHRASGALTRFVGMESPAYPETFVEGIGEGDVILLCSDGLHGMIGEDLMYECLSGETSPEGAVGRLIAEANRAGGLDNVSVAYVRVLGLK
jgi:serine/threonine protein phosphatase PrpC